MATSDRVDREAKIIRGYSVMSLGEAKGHGMFVDETTLSQVLQLGASQPNGVKTRMRHPTRTTDAMGRSFIVHDGFGRTLGKSRNFRREGDRVVADLHLSEAAFKSPEGDLGTYVMELAASEDDTFGASPEVGYTKQRIVGQQLPAMRVKEMPAIAIVDDPATNKGFFSCLSTGDEDMADIAELEVKVTDLSAKNADLSAERDLLTEEVGNLKTRIATLEGENKILVEGKVADLSAAKTDAIAKTLADERNRAADILALCGKSGKAELSSKFIAEGTAVGDVQKQLFDVMCSGNKPIGEGSAADLSTGNDVDAKYKTEYAAQKSAYLSAGVTEEDFVKSRRVDDGLDSLMPTLNAA